MVHPTLSTRSAIPIQTGARLPWLWLAIGAALQPFASVQTVLPIAAWLAPVFLMRFARTQRPVVGLPVVALVVAVGAAVSLRNDFLGITPPLPIFAAIVAGYGLLFSLPYIADRLIAARLAGFARTLVFPAAAVTLDYTMMYSPFLTYGSPSYTQAGNLPLMQVVSLTGMWGLTFLVMWAAPSLNAAWEGGFTWPALRQSVPFALVLAAVLLFGGARLAFFPPQAESVRVAGLTPDRAMWRYEPVGEIARGDSNSRAAMRARTAPVLDDLFARTRLEAAAGAKLVAWSETAAFVLQEDEAEVLERARELAREQGIYLQIGIMTVLRADVHPFGQNHAVLIDPSGDVVWDYHKGYPVPVGDGMEISAGSRIIPSADTPLGRLATIICFDANAPAYIRQAGQAGVDVLLDPSDDWEAIKPIHSAMASFRAVENGVAIVRPTSKGLSTVVDAQGRVLGQADYFATERGAVVASLPIGGTPTLYASAGDLFAYASIAALVGLAGLTLRGRRAAVGAPAGV
jgi:apolipoprotein N-acyltransferase